MVESIKPKAEFFMEICLQVVNNLGGVYTVLTSKSPEMKRYYGENFYAVGPYHEESASFEFEKEIPPDDIRDLIEQLEKENIICHYGKWLIPGSPKTFLIDFSNRLNTINRIKKDMKSKYNIDFSKIKFRKKDFIVGFSLKAFESELIWGDAVNIFMQKLLSLERFKKKTGVLHFHFSDPSGFLIADLKQKNANVGLVATSHSTRLGRAIALNGEDIYKEMKTGLKKGKTVNKGREKIYGSICNFKHYMELIYAKYCDVFTSVSEVTAQEGKYILGRKSDIITPNGLQMDILPSQEEKAIVHLNAKERIYRFLNAYFLPFHPVDIPNSLLFFTSGRYELTTKGYDIMFEALGKLNEVLKKEEYKNNIFVFLFIMTNKGKQANEEILENMAVYDAIEHSTRLEFPHIEKRIINSLVHGHEIDRDIIFEEHFLMESKKLMLKFKRKDASNPPIYAFKGLGEEDPIYKLLLKCGLDNKSDDKVKVIFYPAPVSVADGLLSMEYYEVMSGMHLGIFPSLYEPWGYTPLETAAHNVMSITTDVAGFGKFIKEKSDQRKKPGILVLTTRDRKREEIVDDLADMMYWVTKLPRKERVTKKMEANKLALSADWKEFAKYYIQAHNLAIEKCNKRQKTKKAKEQSADKKNK